MLSGIRDQKREPFPARYSGGHGACVDQIMQVQCKEGKLVKDPAVGRRPGFQTREEEEMRGKRGIEMIIGTLLLLCLIQSVAATTTIVVAAAGAGPTSRVAAQIICPDTNDQAWINEAFNRLPPEGGIVQLTQGTFHSSGWIYPTANSPFPGAGADKTTIDVYNAVDPYSLKTATSDQQPTMPADITPATVPSVFVTGLAVTLPVSAPVQPVMAAPVMAPRG